MKWLAYLLIFLIACNDSSPTANTENLPKPDIEPVLAIEAAPSTASQMEDSRNKKDLALAEVEGPGPKIRFEKVRFNFGEIYHADKVNHEFHFTNTGDSPLEIKGVKVSCGCTTPTYSSLPIAPGDSGIIGVTYNSVGKQGTQKATIRVATNDPTEPEVKLYLSGRVLVKPLEEK